MCIYIYFFVSAYTAAMIQKSSTLSNMLMNASEYFLIIGADMNATKNPRSVKWNPSASSSLLSCPKALQQCMLDLSLVDIRRFRDPEAQESTFLSNRHKSY